VGEGGGGLQSAGGMTLNGVRCIKLQRDCKPSHASQPPRISRLSRTRLLQKPLIVWPVKISGELMGVYDRVLFLSSQDLLANRTLRQRQSTPTLPLASFQQSFQHFRCSFELFAKIIALLPKFCHLFEQRTGPGVLLPSLDLQRKKMCRWQVTNCGGG
jgi:hypothetical protein